MVMTIGQRMVFGAIGVAVIFATTLIVARWPDSSLWVVGGVLLLGVLALFMAYRAERKPTPPD
jgi:hypothetical protein